MFMLLKLVILGKRGNIIKATQSCEYIVSLILKYKMQVPITLLLFRITQGSPSRASPYFLSKQCIAFSNIRNCMLNIVFRPFCLFVSQFVCNLKVPSRKSVITLFQVLSISIVEDRALWYHS